MGKTTEYQRKAVDNYRKKYDIFQLRLPKGTKDEIKKQTKNINDFIVECVLEKLNMNYSEPALDPIEEAKTSPPPQSADLISVQDTLSQIAEIAPEELTVEMVQAMFDNKKIKQDEQAEGIRRQKEEIEKERISKLANPEYAATYEQLQRAEIEAKETKRMETLSRARIENNKY